MDDIQVLAVNQMVKFLNGITTIELTKAAATLEGGDSGGPWFQHIGGTNEVCIVGTDVGGNGSIEYYQQIGGIDRFFNTRVPTS